VTPPLTIEEAERVLARLEEVLASNEVVLIGGQAVAVWVAQLARAQIPDLDHFSPMVGVAVFNDSDGVERKLDFLPQPYGMNADDVANSAIRILISVEQRELPLWVMHPQRCLESRILNTALPDRRGLDPEAHAIAPLGAYPPAARLVEYSYIAYNGRHADKEASAPRRCLTA
jgi:hypothetical protein